VHPLLQDLDEANAQVGSRTRELAGVLRVLAPLVAGFHGRYPSAHLDIEVDTQRDPQIENFDITLLGASAGFDANLIERKINSTEAILLASQPYLARRGVPGVPADLLRHDRLQQRHWVMFNAEQNDHRVELDVLPVLWANHTDTLIRAALDGAGITSTAVELAAPHLASGALVRVLKPWITGRFTLYAALPSRKFLPQRTQVFLEHLTEQTRLGVASALAACDAC
jgi:DNA-binding transcriptional LysR family regulator